MNRHFCAALAAAVLAAPALADDAIIVSDAYARISPHSGAVFMLIENRSDQDALLQSAESAIAERIELHTHREDANGVMQMLPIEGGISIPAGESASLARGGDHVMLMGLVHRPVDGDRFMLTLVFEGGLEVPVEVVVDSRRRPRENGMNHGQHGSGTP